MQKLLIFFAFQAFSLPIFSQSFTEDSLTLTLRGCPIRGSVEVPTGVSEKNPSPLVLILAGSGPTDRNGNSPMGITPNSYKILADSLAAHGIASARYDKRGIAASVAPEIKEADLRFDDYINDAADWLRALRGDRRFSKIVICGHSEGSLVGMMAAKQAAADGFVSLAGAGRRIDEIIMEQLKEQGFDEKMLEKSRFSFDTLLAGQVLSGSFSGPLKGLFRKSVQPYMISWLKLSPTDELKKLTCPVLILQGTTDFQVKTSEAERLAAAKPEAKLAFIEGMNHVLKTAPDAKIDRMGNRATYLDPKLPLAPGLVDALVGFVLKK